jgi:hypothetical protein
MYVKEPCVHNFAMKARGFYKLSVSVIQTHGVGSRSQ